MINADVNTRDIARQIRRMSYQFGESNDAAIARWGVAVCRDLIKETQTWGIGADARKKQIKAISKDAAKVVFGVDKASIVNRISNGRLNGLTISGELIRFTPDRILKTPEEVIAFMELHRTNRVQRISYNRKAIASKSSINKAIKIKAKRAGVAKGGWIGAGISIGARQRVGSRITIGKNLAGYAHKFKSGGASKLTRSQWNPVGEITNNVRYVSTEYVLKSSASRKAINEGGQKTVQWYQAALNARLRR